MRSGRRAQRLLRALDWAERSTLSSV